MDDSKKQSYFDILKVASKNKKTRTSKTPIEETKPGKNSQVVGGANVVRRSGRGR